MMESLSRTALLILGIIANEPINPYTMCKLINHNRRNLRTRVPDQTVFSIIKMLNKKGLISGKKYKKGLMPDMTVYSITQRGLKQLKGNLLLCISAPEDPLTNLVLSMMLVCYLDKNEVLKALIEYREKIKVDINTRKKLIAAVDLETSPFTRVISARHILNMNKVNLKTVNELIESLEANPRTENFPIPWWREEFQDSQKTKVISANSDSA